MEYTKTKLKQIKQGLEFGDIKRIADDCQTSTTTVQTALSGVAMTDTHRMIVGHADYIVNQNKERKARILQLGKESFHNAKQKNG